MELIGSVYNPDIAMVPIGGHYTMDVVKITVTEMDMETMGTSITVEGININYNYLIKVIEDMGIKCL